ncbi:HAD family hydrolase [Rubritalea tangerina]|uniref:HAD family hydrolase n=1 Tax=Rubritalea tangerina TaxID=430798 RepID=A0ABW4Z7X0_9BACT
MTEAKPHGYALFDLDQTIVPWDTQLLFCNFILKRERVRVLYLGIFAPIAIFAKLLGPETMKRVFLNYLAGMDAQVLDKYAREFVDQLIPEGLYAEVVERVEKHKADGVLTVLNSASPEIWVKYIAEKLGFDHYYGTQVAVGTKVKLFPDIIGVNNKGEAKIGRMASLFPDDWQEGDILPNSHGYSDSHADLPMLMLCERNTMVHPTEKLEVKGQQLGWQLMKPKRPTQTKLQFGLACARQALGIY